MSEVSSKLVRMNTLSTKGVHIVGNKAVSLTTSLKRFEEIEQSEQRARESEARADQLENLANRDHKFPALYNHRAYLGTYQKLQEAHKKAQVEGVAQRAEDTSGPLPHTHSLIMMDLDHFKTLNDKHGHDYGDYVLHRVAEITVSDTRDNDLPFRFGGEEIGVVLAHTDMDGAMIAAEKLRSAIEEDGLVTVSIGVAPIDLDMPAEANIKMTDLALYDSKDGGRNRVSAYSNEDHLQKLQDSFTKRS